MTRHFELLRCPVCGGELFPAEHCLRCSLGHSFDVAKEGYVNLMRTHRRGDTMGDAKQAARFRRDFLNKGYYEPLRSRLVEEFAHRRGTVLDICCGEGYYTSALGQNPALTVYGFDLAREMVRLAAKRGGADYFVANLAQLPVQEGSFDYAVHLFAPFQERAFVRLLQPGGRLYTVLPGRRHLFGLKQAVYDRPYENDETLPQTQVLRPAGRWKVCSQITLACPEDIRAVFRMTPYYYRTSPADRQKLEGLQTLTTEIEFVLAAYDRPED